ncbi:MAG TPA: hypothetical protein VH234_06365 [Candidatus Saccharimonadales bacterium]|jgi:hypothetical protein|nr:hypothetical protein [Candidatus Saccharimonadales bacterium]
MKYKIGVYGSAAGDMTAASEKAKELGRVLGNYADSIIILTGATSGLPDLIASEAAAKGVEVWGYAHTLDEASWHKAHPDNDISIYQKIIYVPTSYPLAKNKHESQKYRNVISTANCDAGIFVSGRWGTLNEFTNLIDFQKSAGVLTGTGGIADELPALTQKIHKAGQGAVIFDDNPKKLVEKLLADLESKKPA